jgi:hypothetical protein
MAITIVRNRKSGLAARTTVFSNGWSVRTWWFPEQRSWVTQILDPIGNQMDNDTLEPSGSNAPYNGHAAGAVSAHRSAVDLVLKKLEEPCN